MTKLRKWFESMLSDALSRSIATLIGGALIPIVIGIVYAVMTRALPRDVTVPFTLLLILSLFAIVGVVAAAVPLWRLIPAASSRRSVPIRRDPAVEAAASDLLARLAEIETGKKLYVDMEIQQYHASTLSYFDTWETAVAPYLAVEDLERIQGIRAQIVGRSLHHSMAEAREWVIAVKSLTDKARAGAQGRNA